MKIKIIILLFIGVLLVSNVDAACDKYCQTETCDPKGCPSGIDTSNPKTCSDGSTSYPQCTGSVGSYAGCTCTYTCKWCYINGVWEGTNTGTPFSAGTICQDISGSCNTDPCKNNQYCSGGSCVGGTEKNCNDGNGCTKDYCSGGICYNDKNIYNGQSCEDGDSCSIGERCSNGVCSGGSNPCAGANECQRSPGSCTVTSIPPYYRCVYDADPAKANKCAGTAQEMSDRQSMGYCDGNGNYIACGSPVNSCFSASRCWDGGIFFQGSPVCCGTTYEIWSNGLFQETSTCEIVPTAAGCGMDWAFQEWGQPGATLRPRTGGGCVETSSCSERCAGNADPGYSNNGGTTCYIDPSCTTECCGPRWYYDGTRCGQTDRCELWEVLNDETCCPIWDGWYRLPGGCYNCPGGRYTF